MRFLGVLLLLAVLVVPSALARPAESARVASVTDGDTIKVTSGARVRLLQIDTPEVGSGECYSRAATRALRRLLPIGTAVDLEADGRLDRVDRYGRLLRYVHARGRNVNLELVRLGAARTYFYGGERGRYAGALLAAEARARRSRLGLWGACRPAATGSRGSCDPSYPDVCIPPSPPDLDCADVPHRYFRVVGADPHRFDGDGDGRGCER